VYNQNSGKCVTGAHLSSIKGWIRRVKKEGISGLLDKKYPGARPKLESAQKDKLVQIVEQGPEIYGLDTGVWTGPLIKEVILKEFGVTYHVSQVRRILHQLGFTVQYPRVRLSKADVEKQRTWLRETLPAIKKKSPKREAS
jgi:transposase